MIRYRTLFILICAAALAMLAGGPRGSARADDAALEAEYQRRFQALAADDLAGHVELAKWARTSEAWNSLQSESEYILKLDANHQLAKLMLDLAKSKIAERDKAAASASPQPSPGGANPGNAAPAGPAAKMPKPLTDEQVQALRRAELHAKPLENAQVSFQNGVIDKFLLQAGGRGILSPADKEKFNKASNTEKAAVMLETIKTWKTAATADQPFEDLLSTDIVIKTDPLPFKAFKGSVEKVVLAGCASAKCHGGDQAVAFRLFGEPGNDDKMHYANYLVLNEYDDKGKLIDRAEPERSLIFAYGDAVKGGGTAHPSKIDPVFRTADDNRRKAILQWIRNLGTEAPDYDVDVQYEP